MVPGAVGSPGIGRPEPVELGVAHVDQRTSSGRDKLPESDLHFVTRVQPQPYLRFDRNDYSLDPRQ